MATLDCWSNYWDGYRFYRVLPNGARLRTKVKTCCGEYCTDDSSDFSEGVFVHSAGCKNGCQWEFKAPPDDYAAKCLVYGYEMYALCWPCFTRLFEIHTRKRPPIVTPKYLRVSPMVVSPLFESNPKSARKI